MTKPSVEPHPLKLNSWKATPVTVGLLIAFIVGVVSVSAFTRRSEKETRQIITSTVDKTLREHCERRVESAHPDISRAYVPRTEVQEKLHAIENRLGRIETTQQQILQRLPRRRRDR